MSNEIGYLDFEISIRKAGENEYIVRAESGDGEAEARFTSPFNEDKRALIDATLTKVALRSSAKVRSSSAPEVRKMKEVGATLFEQAITGPVREFYYKCQGQADQQGKGVRWRLSLDPSVGNLPWEFMYLQDEFLALNPRSPIVRFIKGAARVAPLQAEHPLRVLVVIASPSDETPLDTAAEKQRIEAALQPLTAQGLVDVTFIEGPDTWERLINTLLPNQTHILHFIGHGAFDEDNSEGVLVMEDADGKAVRIDSERLRVLVQGKSRLRLVVLNSCLGTEGDEAQPFSSMAAGLVRSGIPAVIAMQFEISDRAAREIAQTFYTSIALNLPVDAALTEARRKIFLSDRDSLEWATPILFMQVPDGQLFQFNLDAAKETKPPLPNLPEATKTQPGTTAAPAKRSSAKTGTAPARQGESFEVKAAQRYQEGEDSMGGGKWAEAANAFRGALIFVPSFRDAAQKLSLCESRDKAASLYLEAQKLCADKKYYQALQTLTKVSGLDPDLADDDNIRAVAECGQKYQRALGELQQGNQQAGAELLRDVISCQADFADAAERLENLAQGGDGLLGLKTMARNSAAANTGTGAPPPASTGSGVEARRYEISNPDTRALAEDLRQCFFTAGHESQIIQHAGGWIVQGKKEGLISWIGMGQAATVTIETTSNGLKVSIGGGKWLEQGVAMTAGAFLTGGILLVTGGIGMAQQKQLMDTLWRMAENFVLTRGGRRVE